MIKAVIFDLDDTLYDYKGAHRKAMPFLVSYAETELGMSGERFLRETDALLQEQLAELGDRAGAHSRAIRFQRMMERNGLPLRHAPVLCDLYWTALLQFIQPAPGAKDLLAALRQRGIRIGLGSDMTADWQLKKLQKLGLLDFFNFVVTSEESAEKPDSRLFALCTKKADCTPAECLFVGDNLRKDVQGANAFGMHGVWLQPSDAEASKQPYITRVADLSGILSLV